MLFFKIIILQTYWYLAVAFGPKWPDAIFIFLSALMVSLNYQFYSISLSRKVYLNFILGFSLYGFIQDSLLSGLDIFSFSEKSYPFWMNSLYVVFICYYNDVFRRFQKYHWGVQALFGGGGGALAYWGGLRLGSLAVKPEHHTLFLVSLFLSWAIFFPLSLKVYWRYTRQT